VPLTDGDRDRLSKLGFYRLEVRDGETYAFFRKSDVPAFRVASQLGEKVSTNFVILNAQKTITNPGNFFSISGNKVRIPSNLESAANSGCVGLITLYGRLGVEMEIVSETLTIPSFSVGWVTNMSSMLDFLLKVENVTRRKAGEVLPFKIGHSASKRLLDILIYKWATKQGLAAYLIPEIRKAGNASLQSFMDMAKGWGTPLDGNLAGRLTSSLYDLASYIANHVDLYDVVPKGLFLSGLQVKNTFNPPRNILEKKGKESKVVQKGFFNVLRFDTMRFLTPSERMELKSHGKSYETQKVIELFDRLPLRVRDYPKLEADLKERITGASQEYFRLRRAARSRLYAIKEVRREAKQSDLIADADFNNSKFIDSVCHQADSIIVDQARRQALKARLTANILSAAVGVTSQ
jgi:hypothetical protein